MEEYVDDVVGRLFDGFVDRSGLESRLLSDEAVIALDGGRQRKVVVAKTAKEVHLDFVGLRL